MAAGEYVSVSSQADTEKADLAREKSELEQQPDFERQELARIYEKRGVDPKTAATVADQMMAQDALGAHARDELGMSATTAARPLQAAIASALAFTAGAVLRADRGSSAIDVSRSDPRFVSRVTRCEYCPP